MYGSPLWCWLSGWHIFKPRGHRSIAGSNLAVLVYNKPWLGNVYRICKRRCQCTIARKIEAGAWRHKQSGTSPNDNNNKHPGLKKPGDKTPAGAKQPGKHVFGQNITRDGHAHPTTGIAREYVFGWFFRKPTHARSSGNTGINLWHRQWNKPRQQWIYLVC